MKSLYIIVLCSTLLCGCVSRQQQAFIQETIKNGGTVMVTKTTVGFSFSENPATGLYEGDFGLKRLRIILAGANANAYFATSVQRDGFMSTRVQVVDAVGSNGVASAAATNLMPFSVATTIAGQLTQAGKEIAPVLAGKPK